MENYNIILAMVIPSVVILVATQLWTKALIQREKIRKEADLMEKKRAVLFPLQMQAYERVTMLIERISPDNLVIRTNRAGMGLIEFQQQLFAEINQEYTHNISQQVYLSDKAWTSVKKAIEMLKSNINQSAMELRGNTVAVSTDLAKKILERAMREKHDSIQESLKVLRAEVKKL